MSIPCPSCSSELEIHKVHRGWIIATCYEPCPVQCYAPSEQALLKAFEDNEWVKENLEAYRRREILDRLYASGWVEYQVGIST